LWAKPHPSEDALTEPEGLPTELHALLERGGVESRLLASLSQYGAMVLEANRHFNVTGAKTPGELAGHILDSLTILPYLREPYIDLGAGAGLPAIPVAIATGIEVTMVESTAKKARLLEELLAELGLRGTVYPERAELLAHRPDLRERFASGTARALGSAPTVAELLLPFIEVGAQAVLQRGVVSVEERRALDDASLMLGGAADGEVELSGERRILLLRKIAQTPPRFPRRPGIPAKRPLCV
jgi:16S rRNA (guanine527-N7)-methyltransferase